MFFPRPHPLAETLSPGASGSPGLTAQGFGYFLTTTVVLHVWAAVILPRGVSGLILETGKTLAINEVLCP